jgi:type II secretory pathway pseudopilin PulG
MLVNKNKKSYGFALVEVMISCAILSTVTIALLSYAQKGLELSNLSLRQTQANYLLEEGGEAVKTIRDANWSNISGLTLDTNYYLSYDTSTNVWSLSATPSLVDGIFTRKIVFSAVYRDSNDDIVASGGTLDTGTKKVTVTTSWAGGDGASTSKTLTFYISNIF